MESASAFFEVLGISGQAIKELLEGNAKLEVVDDDKREQAEFSLKFLDAAGKVVLITGGALRQLMVTKLKALDKASAKVKLDEYYKFMRFVDVLGQLGANVRASQWRRASIKTLVGSNVERALRYFSSSETPDGCGVLAMLRTQKFKIGAGAAAIMTNTAALPPTASILLLLLTSFRRPLIEGLEGKNLGNRVHSRDFQFYCIVGNTGNLQEDSATTSFSKVTSEVANIVNQRRKDKGVGVARIDASGLQTRAWRHFF